MVTIRAIIPFILQTALWVPTRIALNFFVHLDVRGLENVRNTKGPIIFAVNHVSELDPILVPASLPFFSRFHPIFYTARKSYLDSIRGIRKHFYGGMFFKAWGAYPVVSGQRDYSVSLKNHIDLLNNGHHVCIFPEGRISKDGNVGTAHGGTAYLVCHTNSSIVPVSIQGAFGIKLKDFFMRRKKISVTFCKPLTCNLKQHELSNTQAEDYRVSTQGVLDILQKTATQHTMSLHHIEDALHFIKDEGLYPDIASISGPSTNPEITVNGRKVIAFCSNNYLGLATHPEIISTVLKGAEEYGMGSGGSRLVSGNIEIQEQLEAAIAKFKDTESAILFSTGYMANTGVIPALIGPLITSKLGWVSSRLFNETGVIFSDALNHASIVDGARLAKAERVIYKHRDMQSLRKVLEDHKHKKKKLIVTDGVFSMDGDIAPLPEIIALAETYDAIVLVDDAHGTGVLGKSGRGTLEHFNIAHSPRVVVMGTFTKSFGGVGGFVAGPRFLIDYLRITARSYIFSAPIPPAIALGLLKSVQIVSNDESLRTRIWDNITYLRESLEKNGFNILESRTQIMPVIVGDEKKCQEVSRQLLAKGIFVPCVRWPAVEKGKARLRVTIMSTHTKDQIDTFVRSLIEVRQSVHF